MTDPGPRASAGAAGTGKLGPSALATRIAELCKAGQLDAAAAALAELERAFPSGRKLPVEGVRVGLRTRNLAEVRRHLRTGLKRFPDHLKLRRQGAAALRALARPEEALQITAEVCAEPRAPVPLLLEHARILRQLGRFEEAGATLDRAEEGTTDAAGLCAERARLLLASGDLQRALATVRSGLAAHADDPALIGVGATALRRLGRPRDALEIMAPLMQGDRGPANLLNERSRSLRALGRFERADRCLQLLEQRTGRSPALCIQQVALACDVGDSEKAAYLLKCGLEAFPDSSQLRLMQMRLARDGGDVEEALRGLGALRSSIGGKEFDAREVELLLAANRLEAALERARAFWIRAQPDGEALFWYGRALLMSGRPDEAERLLDTAKGHAPETLRLRLLHAEALWRRGKLDEAVERLKGSPPRLAHDPALLGRLGVYLCQTGRHCEVRNLVAEWQPQSIQDRKNRFRLMSLVAMERGDMPCALGHMERAPKLASPGPGNDSMLGLLKMLNGDLRGARESLGSGLTRQLFSLRASGRSVKLSNTLFGQFLNELELESELSEHVLKAANQASRAPPPLTDVHDRAGDTLGPALALCIAMRRMGHVTTDAEEPIRSPSGRTDPAIPRRIHQYWDAAEPPDVIVEASRHWAETNPEFQYQLYDDKGARALFERHELKAAARAYRLASHAAQKADLFRLACLLVHGGVYVDVDDRCRLPLRELIPAGAELLVYQELYLTIGNNFVAAAPGHPMIEFALNSAAEELLAGTANKIWLTTGPGLMTRSFAATSMDPATIRPLPGNVVVSRSVLRRYVAIHTLMPHKRSDDSWQNSQLKRGAARRTIEEFMDLGQ